jgi:hypothetical protein
LITRADLDRGEERYNIYRSPCHSRTGDGNGWSCSAATGARRHHQDRLRQAPLGYLFDVMTNGFGDARLPGTGDRRDRWRIVAHIKALQLAHSATTADVPAKELEQLKSGKPPAAAPAAGHGGGEKGGQQ